MTEAYDWNPMPHKVDIKCPECGCQCAFEHAEVVKIREKKDATFFQESDKFDYHFIQEYSGQRWHGAVYNALLHGGSTDAITELPVGYVPGDWDHSKYLMRSHALVDWGAISCTACGLNDKHKLDWPKEAYFSIQYRSHQLWGFNRESFVECRDYLNSTLRDTSKYKWGGFLLHIPTVFKKQKAREPVVKLMTRQLGK